jgi:hypothetical protein
MDSSWRRIASLVGIYPLVKIGSDPSVPRPAAPTPARASIR